MTIRFKPRTKKIGYYITAFIVFYWLLIRQRRITDKFEITVSDINPKNLWEYWADFSNYKKINPTILEFEIDYEKGTYENWEYGVSYTEYLTLLPFKVYMKGKFIVTPEQTRGHFTEPFRILSEQDACVWIFCTHIDADMTFTKVGNGKVTKVSETVTFGCPILLTSYQLSEFRTQRQHITEELQKIDFSSI